MNILFLTLMKINSFSQTGIYPDLVNEFADNGHDIYVVSPCEQKDKEHYELIKEQGHIHLVNALIPNYFEVGLLQKGISSIMIENQFMNAINAALPSVRFDLVLYSTPPITFCGVIERIKKRDKASTYLLLKDIWPQGPIDIGALSTTGFKGIITRYFKKKEKRLYDISDYVGCMSERNCQYLIEHSEIDKEKVEICPNSIKIRNINTTDKITVRKENNLPLEKIIFMYGGNLGIAQGIDFIVECLEKNEENDSTFILIVGAGTEYTKLEKWFKQQEPKNSRLLSYLPQNEYMKVMAACDVGLIFLDHRFTIPNFPSRLLSYMEGRMPVLVATDPNTDVGIVAEKGGFGYWCESNDSDQFISLMKKFDEEKCKHMGECAFRYLNDHYGISKAYNTIMAHFIEEAKTDGEV